MRNLQDAGFDAAHILPHIESAGYYEASNLNELSSDFEPVEARLDWAVEQALEGFVASCDTRLQPTLVEAGFWLNFTSPLKHQFVGLSAGQTIAGRAVGELQGSTECHSINSVNTMSITDEKMTITSSDGDGVVDLAVEFGIDFSSPSAPILLLHGGGGAARSVAAAWTKAGGRIHQVPSHRVLGEGPWDLLSESEAEQSVADFGVSFNGETELVRKAKIVLESTYDSSILPSLQNADVSGLDGRWMLVAQHLYSWKTCWAQGVANFLPGIRQCVELLLAAESLLQRTE